MSEIVVSDEVRFAMYNDHVITKRPHYNESVLVILEFRLYTILQLFTESSGSLICCWTDSIWMEHHARYHYPRP
jgi:hypothetical protein